MIGLTLPLVNDLYFGPMLSGASEALYEADMRIVLCPTMHEHDREVSLLDRLMHGTTDGAILVLDGLPLQDAMAKLFGFFKLPRCLVGRGQHAQVLHAVAPLLPRFAEHGVHPGLEAERIFLR